MSITLEWKQPATSVIVTGTFDNWSRSVLLQNYNGVFRTTIPGQEYPIVFKFIVDGEWVLSNDYPIVSDAQGNQNHQLEFVAVESTLVEPVVVQEPVDGVGLSTTTESHVVEPAVVQEPVDGVGLSVSPSDITVSQELVEPATAPKEKKKGLKRKLTKLWKKMTH